MMPPTDHVNTSNRDRNITPTKGGPTMTTRSRHLTAVPACRPARPLGADGTPANLTRAEAAPIAATLADQLAAQADFGPVYYKNLTLPTTP
jgi:hypothetical protein